MCGSKGRGKLAKKKMKKCWFINFKKGVVARVVGNRKKNNWTGKKAAIFLEKVLEFNEKVKKQ